MNKFTVGLATGLLMLSQGHAKTVVGCQKVTAGGNVSGYVVSATCSEQMISLLLQQEQAQQLALDQSIRSDISMDARVFRLDSIKSNHALGNAFSEPLLTGQEVVTKARSMVTALKFEAYQPASANLLALKKSFALVNPNGTRTIFAIYGDPFGASPLRTGQLLRMKHGILETSQLFLITGEILKGVIDSLDSSFPATFVLQNSGPCVEGDPRPACSHQ